MEPTNSTFQFQGFYINKSVFSFREKLSDNIKIDIVPNGIYYKNDQIFHLKLEVKLLDEDNEAFINVIGTAKFKLQNIDISEENMDGFFGVNAPALFFPYIRAYIANLTVQSGLKVITLPTLNLTKLKDTLKHSLVIKD